MLSRSITCEASVMSVLTPATMELANIVVKEIDEEDSGLLVQITNQNNLHMALALQDSPVPQGVNADASLIAFRDWLIAGARSIRADSQVPSNSNVSLAFHRLTQGEALDIMTGEWLQTEWIVSLRANRRGPIIGDRIGEFVMLFWMAGTGRQQGRLSLRTRMFD